MKKKKSAKRYPTEAGKLEDIYHIRVKNSPNQVGTEAWNCKSCDGGCTYHMNVKHYILYCEVYVSGKHGFGFKEKTPRGLREEVITK